ncbi:MAG TPA: hypothetical protein VFD12_01665 [Oligella sp.]|nr:hypothetical protein [Oligella sp.]
MSEGKRERRTLLIVSSKKQLTVERYTITNTTLNVLSQPDETGTDVLTALLRNRVRQLTAQAVEAAAAFTR